MCSRARAARLAACALAVAGCGGAEERTALTASLSSVEPVCASTSSDTPITLRGAMPVKPVVSLSGGSESSLEAQYRAWVGDVELGDVRWVDAGSITATVPAGVAPGVYPLTIESPFGDRTSIDALFEVAAGVCNPASAGLRIDASGAPAVVGVGDRVVLTVAVRNTGQATATGVTTAVVGPPGFTLSTSPTDPLDIPGGESRSFTWIYTAEVGAGNGTFAVTAAGLDSSSGESVSAPEATTNRVAVTYAVGGTAFGLEGSGLVLQLNGASDRAVTVNGAFTFGELPSGTDFQVTIASQPANPTQTCNVSGGVGTVGTGPVTAIVVNCAVNTFTIGGRVTGLVGSGLVLREATSNQTAAITSAGTYAFAIPVPSGRTYAVTVSAQPAGPAQTCTVANGSGTVAAANVSNADVSCTTNPVTLAVAINGTGSGTVLCNGGPCQSTYAFGTVVSFTTQAATGSEFQSWGGDCSGAGPCALTMTANSSVTANFALRQFGLTTLSSPAGSGAVRCNGGPCLARYTFSTAALTLTAEPAPGWQFANWSGDCAGSGPCTVTMTTDHTVTANFVQVFTLSAAASPQGSGALLCGGAPCAATYVAGTSITIEATANVGWAFTGWVVDGSATACPGTGACTVAMTANRAVTAHFVRVFTFTVSAGPPGSGSVTCDGVTCASTYTSGTTLILASAANPGWEFTGWLVDGSAAICPGTGTCQVTVTANRTVTANFVQLFTLLVATAGEGAGTVSCNGGPCSSSYRAGTFLTLNAAPSTGSDFDGWSGDCNGRGSCQVTMNQNHAVTATFVLFP